MGTIHPTINQYMNKEEVIMGIKPIRVMVPRGNQEMITNAIKMLQDPQVMEGHLHQDTVFSVKPILMTQAFVKLLNIQQIINLTNVRSITHVICVSRQVSVKPTLALRS